MSNNWVVWSLRNQKFHLFNLDFANYTNHVSLIMFLFLFVNYWLICLILAVIADIFNPIAKIVISIGIPIKEAEREIEIHPVNAKAKIKRCLV